MSSAEEQKQKLIEHLSTERRAQREQVEAIGKAVDHLLNVSPRIKELEERIEYLERMAHDHD